MSRGAKEPGIHELVRLTRFLLDTAKVEDLPEMLHAMCPTASRKILLAHLLISSTASSLQQMLGMLHAEPVAAAEILVQVITNIEGECPIQLQEHSDGSFSLNEEKTVQGAICRVVSLDVGDTCEKYAEDLVRLGVQLPLWTSRDIARFSSSPNLQEKVVNWFVASLSDQVLVLLQGCCLVSNLHTALPRPAPSCAQIVAECLAAAEAFRECLLQSAYLLKSNKCVESLIWDLLQPKSAELVPHCEERFGCILGGALEAQVRHVETMQPHARLHSLWRLGSVVLTWRHLVQLCCEDEDQFLTFLAKPGNYTSWRPGCSAKMVGKAYHHQVISPMMEEEQRAWCEVAERAANEAMAELLAEPDQASGSKRKAKRGKKSDAKSEAKSDAGPACSGTNGYAQKNAEEASTLAMEDLELPESLIQSWQHLTVQLLMMERGSPRDP